MNISPAAKALIVELCDESGFRAETDPVASDLMARATNHIADSAYLNEKPHEPNPDSVHFSVEHADGTVTDYGLKPAASTPHAACPIVIRGDESLHCTRCGNSWMYTTPPASCRATHAAAEPEKPRLHEFQRKRIVRACEEAEHPIGMSTHSGYARVLAHDVRKLLAIVDASPPAQPIAREPTEAMLEAGWKVYYQCSTPTMMPKIWIAMYDALKSAGKE